MSADWVPGGPGGAQQPRPVNAPRAVPLGVGVQPGTQSVVRATKVIVSGANGGVFIYAPTPGPGNLVISEAGAAGVDQYGNAYPEGLSALTGTLSGQQIIASVFQGVNLRIDQQGIFLYETVTTPIPPAPNPVPYFIGGNAANAGAATIVIPVSNPTSAADTIHVAANAAFGTSTVVSATDSKGNTYSIKVSDNSQIPVTALVADNTNNALGTVALSTADTITVTYSGTTGAKCASAAGVTGLNANPFDGAATPLNADGNSAAPSLVTGNLVQASEVVIGSLASSNSGGAPTWAAGITQLDRQQLGTGQYLTTAYLTPAAASSITLSATLAAAGRWGLLAAPLKE